MSKKKGVSIDELARKAGCSSEVARQIGRKGLLNQLLERFGHPTTRCEDASGSGWTGDLEEDLESTGRRR